MVEVLDFRLQEEDVRLIAHYDAAQFCAWLIKGLANQQERNTHPTLEKPFHPLDVFIGLHGDIGEDIRHIYLALPGYSKVNFRNGVAKAMESIGNSKECSLKEITELLSIAGATRSIEVLNSLPLRYGHVGSLEDAINLYSRTIDLLAGMASWKNSQQEMSDLEYHLTDKIRLLSSHRNLIYYSDNILIGLCYCSPESYTKHLQSLSPHIAQVLQDIEKPLDVASNISFQMASVIDLERIAEDLHEVYCRNDFWVIAGLNKNKMMKRDESDFFLLGKTGRYLLKTGGNAILKEDLKNLKNEVLFLERYKKS